MECHKQSLLEPSHLYFYQELAKVPKKRGVYAWYFREVPPHVPIEKCRKFENHTLLYVGQASKQTLHDRIRNHYCGKACSSTLRLTIGCLLSEELKIQLHCIGSSENKFKFDNEEKLSIWMKQNAFVVWIEDSDPRKLEKEIITDPNFSLPLNLANNHAHPFHETLSSIRRECKTLARKRRLELVKES
ncbi:MAG: hypothetical protein WAW10_01105 [Gallionella sp.]